MYQLPVSTTKNIFYLRFYLSVLVIFRANGDHFLEQHRSLYAVPSLDFIAIYMNSMFDNVTALRARRVMRAGKK
jgi:hypothetical protein